MVVAVPATPKLDEVIKYFNQKDPDTRHGVYLLVDPVQPLQAGQPDERCILKESFFVGGVVLNLLMQPDDHGEETVWLMKHFDDETQYDQEKHERIRDNFNRSNAFCYVKLMTGISKDCGQFLEKLLIKHIGMKDGDPQKIGPLLNGDSGESSYYDQLSATQLAELFGELKRLANEKLNGRDDDGLVVRTKSYFEESLDMLQTDCHEDLKPKGKPKNPKEAIHQLSEMKSHEYHGFDNRADYCLARNEFTTNPFAQEKRLLQNLKDKCSKQLIRKVNFHAYNSICLSKIETSQFEN